MQLLFCFAFRFEGTFQMRKTFWIKKYTHNFCELENLLTKIPNEATFSKALDMHYVLKLCTH